MTPPHAASGPQQPPIATAVFLYGDLFAAPAAPGTRGTSAFATGQVVPTEVIGQMMYAVGLAHLHQHGAVKLSTFSKKRLRVFTVSGVQIEVLPGGTSPFLNDPIAQAAMKPTRTHEPRTVRDVIKHLVPLSETPYGQVISMAVDNAVRSGYLERSYSGGAFKLGVGRGSHTDLTPVPDRIAAVRPMADALAEDWASFRASDPELAAALREDIGKAIAARQASDNDDD